MKRPPHSLRSLLPKGAVSLLGTARRRLIIHLDGRALTVPGGVTVAAAVAASGDDMTRVSCTGAARAPFCGMGICQECRMTIDGRRRLACQTLCRDGMQVERTR